MKVAVAILLCALPAHAYNEAVHAFITSHALARAPHMHERLTPGDVDAFRALYWRLAVSDSAQFRALYPTQESFSAWEMKQFFMLDPAATVHGFDAAAVEPSGTRIEVLTAASRWPDDDKRNQSRFLRDPKTHEVLRAADGEPMPYDPATLDFGKLSGTSSQAHAHYGLVEGLLSDDPEVLKKDPRRFAVPPTAHAVAREFVELYGDLAIVAATSDLPSRDYLFATFAGAAFHHLEDVANQIHTVQVGVYEFFEGAFWQSKLHDLKTLGGLFGARRSLKQVGLRLISNHHLMSEDLFAKRLPSMQLELQADDAALLEQLRSRPIASAIIDASSLEGPEVYRDAWHFSAKTLRDGIDGHEYDGDKGDNPDDYVDPSKTADLARFYDLQRKGLRRAATGVRAWMAQTEQALQAPDAQRAAVRRTLALLLPYHRDAAKRRAAYVPAAPEELGIAWGYPLAALVLLAAAAALIRSRLSKRS